MSNERHEGTSVVVGDKTYIVPPLSLGKMRKFLPQITAITGGVSDLSESDQLNMMSDIIHSAMVRNYPDMTQEQMEEDVLTIENVKVFMEAVCKASNLVRGKPQGKEEAVGPLTLMN